MSEDDKIVKVEPPEIVIPKKGIIVAADVKGLDKFEALVRACKDIPKIVGYKLGSRFAIQGILGDAVEIINKYYGGHPPLTIYDPQKGATDIPDVGAGFAEDVKAIGINIAILFPFTGPATQIAWTNACFKAGIQVFTGIVMTHPQFLKSEGGYFDDDSVMPAFKLAAELGVRNYIVPGTKLHWIEKIQDMLTEALKGEEFLFASPGLIKQGGKISDVAKTIKGPWLGIVGRDIYEKDDMKKAAEEVVSQLGD